jgi:serine protease inhibitor
MSIRSDMNELLLAIHLNTDLNIQIVSITSFKSQFKNTTTRYNLEYLTKRKVEDENTGEVKVKLFKYKTEQYKSLTEVYQRLGVIYQENIKKPPPEVNAYGS